MHNLALAQVSCTRFLQAAVAALADRSKHALLHKVKCYALQLTRT